jgi:hypothetical protein
MVAQRKPPTTLKTELSDSDGDNNLKTLSLSSSFPYAVGSEMSGISATPFKDRTKRFVTQTLGSGTNFEPTRILSNRPEMNVGHLIKSTQKSNLRERSPSFDATHNLSCRPVKKSRLDSDKEPIYEFFGSNLPPTTKLIALSCLEYLDGPSLYSMSCVNHLWNQAVMDDALWE